MKISRLLYLIGVALLLAGTIIATEPPITRHTPPGTIDFSYDSSWSGRQFTSAESSVVAQAICSIATAPPESITYQNAAGAQSSYCQKLVRY